MAIYGNTTTFSLPALLQWILTEEKTGRLCIERDGICTRVYCRAGLIIGCFSNDPGTLLGQFLRSLGKIRDDELEEAIAEHESCGKRLGRVLVERGTISDEELDGYVVSKAEQTLYDLFDWDDATFHFCDGVTPDPTLTDVHLEVTSILMEGLRRRDEMRHMRSDLGGPAGILRLSSPEVLEQFEAAPMARLLLIRVDEQTPLADILRGAQASEYFALRFLHHLFEAGQVEVARVDREGPPQGSRRGSDMAPEASSLDMADEEDAHAFYEMGHLWDLPASGVPVTASEREEDLRLSPTESFLLEFIDGRDVKSIVWQASLREAEVLEALKKMVDRGIITLGDRIVGTAAADAERAGEQG